MREINVFKTKVPRSGACLTWTAADGDRQTAKDGCALILAHTLAEAAAAVGDDAVRVEWIGKACLTPECEDRISNDRVDPDVEELHEELGCAWEALREMVGPSTEPSESERIGDFIRRVWPKRKN